MHHGGARGRLAPTAVVLAGALLATALAGDARAGGVSAAAGPDDGTRPATLAPEEARELLRWAAHLSGYAEAEVPPVRLQPHAFFVANACTGSSRCRVLGWYADRGVVHVDERLASMDTLFARSLLVHELVHYLQHKSGRFVPERCESFVEREREAYAVQQRYFMAYGALPGSSVHHFSCATLEAR